ncbi:MAG: putative 2-aminoethylphosphonate ABC transporter permease subunit [Clostridiales bacterium]|jgi:iron(III) transport system permease protein|nr:putative 2-aminoethylphosphonate ABC transporter permease subunit [Clostridiales bacterium]
MPNKAGRRLPKIPHPAQAATTAAMLAVFTVALLLPLFSLLSKAFLDKSGGFAGLANYAKYFQTPSLAASIWNTIDISLASTAISAALGFLYAYALTRTRIPLKPLFKYAALIPIFMPTIVHALGLVYLFGRQGVLTGMGLQVELYGRFGIIVSEAIFTFPQAFLMFYVALEFADGRLYEAADSMGISAIGKFLRITVPELRYTIVNAFFVCFTLAFTDFGAPKVIGGSYNVLATDIYKQIAGQFNMNMGAVVGTLLLIPAVLSFAVGRFAGGKNSGTISAKSTRLLVKKSRWRDALFLALCSFVALSFLALVASLFMGALASYYPYDMGFTLKHFAFNQSTGGIGSYFNSLEMSLLTAVFGTAFVFLYAYMMEKTSGLWALKKYGAMLSALPVALPGMVIGLAFIFFFNAKSNPLNFIYGTVAILVVSNIVHYFSVPYITATGALKKLDREFESVAESMGIPRWKTFLRVSAPLSLPAILEIFMYFFVNAMVTVSAVVFLYSARFKVASIAISHMEESGDIAQAAAMSLLILAVNVLVRLLYEAAVRLIKRRSGRDGGAGAPQPRRVPWRVPWRKAGLGGAARAKRPEPSLPQRH